MKALIIDDDEDMLAIAAARLRAEDLDVICAPSGEAGLAMAAQHKPDVILLDVEMPGLSGFDVCRKLKDDVELHLIPVIFLTALDDTSQKVQGLELGAVDYVTKPFDAFELRARVQAALRTKQLQDMLIECAMLDPLTGLPNRRALLERAQAEWARCQRKESIFAFIMADVDNFKSINDRFGHAVGDRMLNAIAQSISSQCRQSDMPCRYGGEEFGILVPAEAGQAAMALAQRCRQDVERICIPLPGQDVRVTVSLGVADSIHANSLTDVIDQADRAMYQAKAAGRNTVCPADGILQDTDAGAPPR